MTEVKKSIIDLARIAQANLEKEKEQERLQKTVPNIHMPNIELKPNKEPAVQKAKPPDEPTDQGLNPDKNKQKLKESSKDPPLALFVNVSGNNLIEEIRHFDIPHENDKMNIGLHLKIDSETNEALQTLRLATGVSIRHLVSYLIRKMAREPEIKAKIMNSLNFTP
ncbi:hypothetical protein [Mucilaginibacter lappiensis]|uniref:Uncharacterized protein n=1 Tax=Mucilaginibacter lappiensis TaxID=354630 RepID=A0A841JMN1_9SPHI|nr:hypothetical protein [Mucilaginibacter lappiensis]MBB6131522.1 hypothetical protein [Mucilaginibacter lappiensis]